MRTANPSVLSIDVCCSHGRLRVTYRPLAARATSVPLPRMS